MEELLIGSHVSFKKDTQLLGSAQEAVLYGANTFMFYTGAPQNTARSKIDDHLTAEAYTFMNTHGINPQDVVVHAPYIINLANNANPSNRRFAIEFLGQEIDRCEQLGIPRLILHPGSAVKLTKEEGIQNIIDGLNTVISPEQAVIVCLETMAGKGTEIGNLDDLATILKAVKYPEHVMVCLDTCHLHDAGYDLTAFDDFLAEFDQKIGLDKIACVHINDSKNERGSHKDRHENFGLGYLGFDTLINIVTHPVLKGLPKILETPYVSKDEQSKERVYPPYRHEITMIKSKQFDPALLSHIRQDYK